MLSCVSRESLEQDAGTKVASVKLIQIVSGVEGRPTVPAAQKNAGTLCSRVRRPAPMQNRCKLWREEDTGDDTPVMCARAQAGSIQTEQSMDEGRDS